MATRVFSEHLASLPSRGATAIASVLVARLNRNQNPHRSPRAKGQEKKESRASAGCTSHHIRLQRSFGEWNARSGQWRGAMTVCVRARPCQEQKNLANNNVKAVRELEFGLSGHPRCVGVIACSAARYCNCDASSSNDCRRDRR